MISESVHYLVVHYLMDKCFIVVSSLLRGMAARTFLPIASAR